MTSSAFLLPLIGIFAFVCGVVIDETDPGSIAPWDLPDSEAEGLSPADMPDTAPEYADYTDDDLWDEAKRKTEGKDLTRKESIEVICPAWDDEIFTGDDFGIEFVVHNMSMPEEGKALIFVNGQEVAQMQSTHSLVSFPFLPKNLYMLRIQLADRDGKTFGVWEERAFEIANFAPPESIMPDPPGAIGVYSNASSAPPDLDFAKFSAKVQNYLFKKQHPPSCEEANLLIWESWGVVGFGAQILGLRVGLRLGLESNRVVVNNMQHEAHLVMSELKWRFGQSGSLGSPWGNGLEQISNCTSHADVPNSVRPAKWEDLNWDTRHLLVSGDIFGRPNRDRIFSMPESLAARMPSPPSPFWWWTEVTNYLMRPDKQLSHFVEEQKARMGWKRPVMGMHMRLGGDKSQEAQRFPPQYYIQEARRVKKLFGISRIFICSDRPKAVEKMIAKYGDEFEFVRQPTSVSVLSPQWFVLTDILLLAECDISIISFSSNFGQTVLYLSSFLNGHRPTYISMDDHFEGARYYGWQMKLRRDPETGVNTIEQIDCRRQKCEDMETAMGTGDKRVLGYDYAFPDEEEKN